MYKIKKWLNLKDIKHYYSYGPMDFEFKQAFFYYLILELPIYLIFYLIFILIQGVFMFFIGFFVGIILMIFVYYLIDDYNLNTEFEKRWLECD